MLSILADSFRIATRTEAMAPSQIDRRSPAERRQAANRWFWQGRRWTAPREAE